MQNKAIQDVVNLFDFNSKLFNDRVATIDEDISNKVIGENFTSIKWMSGHLINSRVFILSLVGGSYDFPFAEICKGKFEEDKEYPSMTELLAQWTAINEKLDAAFANLTEEQLNTEIEFKPPCDDPTVRGALIFLLYHEAFHLGQITSIKRNQGLESVLPF